jgi:hypothetical protein
MRGENKMSTIYDQELIKDDKKIKKVYLNYVDANDESSICDCCNKVKPLASINTLSNDTICICKDCLIKIVKEFE